MKRSDSSRSLGDQFIESFGSREDVIEVRSPGRVNLIGEHTDYNEGFVLPAAVDKALVFLAAPRRDGRCRFVAADLEEHIAIDLTHLQHSDRGWPNYLVGVIAELRKDGFGITGCDVVFGGTIPIGAGMSSSAALECGFATVLNELFGLGLTKLDIVKIGQRAENDFVGVKCGIMDQFVNVFGEERKVLKIDCRSLDVEYIPFDRSDVQIVLCETASKRSLASSEYNIRRQQCEEGVRLLKRHAPGIGSLRDVDRELLERYRHELDPLIYRRCAYVVAENQRVLDACDDLLKNDISAFGKRMYESHEGLSRWYEVSSTDLDFLVDTAAACDGVIGARMMGAGFGGCTINLVEQAEVESFVDTIKARTRERSGSAINVYVTTIQAGTRRIASGPSSSPSA